MVLVKSKAKKIGLIIRYKTKVFHVVKVTGNQKVPNHKTNEKKSNNRGDKQVRGKTKSRVLNAT